ncbi:HNH endonuclease signature motif containing protein [Naasia lichenicola]|uniref:DUF222 domain-containing protein n=1 Tax=Naasia lichenicola TaxID=2565933 RepID=A0A4S4FRG2_9MICO|nr:HNH endonuclease signature motif containing protein [Naasia lichenicola]THG33240.1 DUF222 domain-containing protein [Naasia lichenicola]
MSEAPTGPEESPADASGESGAAARSRSAENGIPVRSSWLPSADPLDQKLEMVIWASHSRHSAAAFELQQMDEFRKAWQERYGLIDGDESDPKWRSLIWQLSAEFNLPKSTVENKLGMAKVLLAFFPSTFTRMRSGVVTEQHAKVLVDYLGGLPDQVRIDLEAQLLPHAEKLTLRKFEKKVRNAVEIREPEKMEERHEEAMKDRDCWVDDQRDGMATFSVTMSAVDAYAAFDVTNAQAQALKAKAGDEEARGVGEIRSDVVRDMLLDRDAQLSVTEEGDEVRDVKRSARGIVPTVSITVPVLTAIELAKGGDTAGKRLTPAVLEGYGPIAPSMAVKIARATSGFTRILTDPHYGTPISIGTDRYRPPAEMRAAVIWADGTCRAVGCNRRAKDCDLDHTTPASEGGPTELANLTALCPPDHELKHHGGWTMIPAPDYSRKIYWVSPLGRIYDTEPEYLLPLEDPATTLTCMDPAWVHDDHDTNAVADPDFIPF